MRPRTGKCKYQMQMCDEDHALAADVADHYDISIPCLVRTMIRLEHERLLLDLMKPPKDVE